METTTPAATIEFDGMTYTWNDWAGVYEDFGGQPLPTND